MKKIFILSTIVLGTFLSAQVRINTTTVNDAAILDMSGNTNKGVLLPHVELASLTDQTTITSPVNSLLVYNTKTDATKGLAQGIHFWDNDLTKWVPLVSDKNIDKIASLTKNKSVIGSNGISFKANDTSVPLIDEAPTANDWVELKDLSTTITVDNSSNDFSFSLSGLAQIDNTVSSSGGRGGASFMIGIFMDDKLKLVRPFSFYSPISCGSYPFSSNFTLKNVTTGSHTFKVYALSNNYKQGTYANQNELTIGKPAGSCTNQNAFSSRMIFNVILRQDID